MKGFNYERYDYAFLYGRLTKKQEESIQRILDTFIGHPNNEMTRTAVKLAVDAWLKQNSVELKGNYIIEYE